MEIDIAMILIDLVYNLNKLQNEYQNRRFRRE